VIIYNVTVKVDKQIADHWLQWLLDEHIPGIMKTKCFYDYKVVRLLETDESEGPTFAIQYYTENMSGYTKYLEEFAPHFRQESVDKWGDSFIAFRSVMQVIA
jgi:hypothetical protein